MKLTLYFLLLFYTTNCLANRAWLSKILFRGKDTDANSEEFEDEDEVDDEEDDEDDESLGLFEKGVYLAKRIGVLGVSGAAVYTGYKLFQHFLKRIEKVNVPQEDFSSLSTAELLANLHSEGQVESVSLTNQDGTSEYYTCILFDCEGKISSSTDQKARMDYFTLMSNLTSKVSATTKTVYIPGEKNSHIVEKNLGLASHWLFVSSKSGLGLQKANVLRKRFGVRPEELRIVMLGPDLKVISDNALDLLRLDPKGMPWPQRPIQEVLGKRMLASSGGDVTDVPIAGKKLALYFSASWCKPCTTFLPILVKAYKKSEGTTTDGTSVNEDNVSSSVLSESASEESSIVSEENTSTSLQRTLKDLDTEVVLVSLDKDETEFNAYRSRMPWPALPFRDTRRAELQIGLKVRAIPALLLFDEDGRLLSSSGVTELLGDSSLDKFPWLSLVTELSDGGAVERLERGPALVAFVEGCAPEVQGSVRTALGQVAAALSKPLLMPRSSREDLSLCTLSQDGKLSQALRTVCGLPSASGLSEAPVFAIVDLAAGQYSLFPREVEPTAQSIQKLVESFVAFEVVMEDVDRDVAAAGGGGDTSSDPSDNSNA